MQTTEPIPPETVADLLDKAADLIETQGLLRHEGWIDLHEHGPLGASTALFVAETGKVLVHPMPPVVFAALQLCAYAEGDLDTWADNVAEDAGEVAALLRYVAACEREVEDQTADEVAGTLAGDLVGQGERWRALCAAGRNPHALPVAVAA
ncbi:hypothetical protein [Embleya sp. NPDC005971]|uniref:DUF6197 family protein n=1 Tax=Embleya sp. NPDC005971 TaxID=3156724 RepID=UPI0033FFC20D